MIKKPINPVNIFVICAAIFAISGYFYSKYQDKKNLQDAIHDSMERRAQKRNEKNINDESICSIHNKDCKKIGAGLNMSLEEYHQWQDKVVTEQQAEESDIDQSFGEKVEGEQNREPQKCSACNGTGKCRNCSKTVDKLFYAGNGNYDSRNESRPGLTRCNSCYGRGHVQVRRSEGGWEPSRDCYVSICNDGWIPCGDCNSSGRGNNLGQCRECKGLGNRQ